MLRILRVGLVDIGAYACTPFGVRLTYSDFHESERCVRMIFTPFGAILYSASAASPNPALTAPRILKGRISGTRPEMLPGF